jgi:hypothetical protein
MKIINCGPDELTWAHNLPEGEVEWLIYWYESGSYEGSGSAYAKTADGRYWEMGLGHCSCYGPNSCDEKSWEIISKSEIEVALGIKSGETPDLHNEFKALAHEFRILEK